MNFATLKGLTIPEGNVQSIVIDGKTMWTKTGNSPGTNPSDDPWDAVFASIDAGTYATDYAIGDTVPLDLGSEGVVNMQIAAFDADALADGSGNAHISFVSKELLKTKHRMNPAIVTNDDGTYQEGTGTIGGWEKCEMRSYLTATVLPLIPEKVRSRIKPVIKHSDSYDLSATAVDSDVTTDSVWVPSANEIYGVGYEQNGVLYTRLFNGNTARVKAYSNWALRSAKNNQAFYVAGYNGAIVSVSATTDVSVALGFCT